MAFTDKGAREALKSQEYTDCIASLARSRQDLIDERDEIYKDVELPDNLVTPEDHINYVRSVVLRFGKEKTGKKSGKVLEEKPKKKCLNCGSVKIMRQRDENKKGIVWIDEYKCLDCKERMVL